MLSCRREMTSLVKIRLAACDFQDAELGDGTWTQSTRATWRETSVHTFYTYQSEKISVVSIPTEPLDSQQHGLHLVICFVQW